MPTWSTTSSADSSSRRCERRTHDDDVAGGRHLSRSLQLRCGLSLPPPGRPETGRPTYDTCDFALSWQVRRGSSVTCRCRIPRSCSPGRSRRARLAGPGASASISTIAPRRTSTLLFPRCFLERRAAPRRATIVRIGEVYAVRQARITLEHAPRRWFIRADEYVTVRGVTPVLEDGAVSCGIPATITRARNCKPTPCASTMGD